MGIEEITIDQATWIEEITSLLRDNILFKVALFLLVQALVYAILSYSSNLFWNTSSTLRSTSFRIAPSVSIRINSAALSDLPAGGEPSPLFNSLEIDEQRRLDDIP